MPLFVGLSRSRMPLLFRLSHCCLRLFPRCSRHRLPLFAWVVAALLTLPVSFGLAQDLDLMTPAHLEQRQWYQQARRALAVQDTATFNQYRTQLAQTNYALLPYLDYAELSARLDSFPEAEVHAFVAAHAGSVLALRLQRQWLQTLAGAERWPQLIADYDPDSATTELRCQVLLARLQAGDAGALDEVAPLWNVPRSQPNLCDPLFDAWRAAGGLTPTLAWERFQQSIETGQTNLARYVATLLPAREEALATLWLDTLRQPTLLRDQSRYAGAEPPLQEALREESQEELQEELQEKLHDLLLHTLRQLAQSDAALAWELEADYAAQQAFSAEDRQALQRYIVLRLMLQDQVERAQDLLRADPTLPSDTLVEWLLRDALKQQDWVRMDAWLPLLSDEARASERWRYWQARSLARHADTQTAAQAQELFAQVADTRSFYGFLSADLLGRGYAFVDRPIQMDTAELNTLMARPALLRAFELHLVDDEDNAVSEWRQALSRMDERETLGAGVLAERLGWYSSGIQALIQVSYWDDLAIRFPLAYREAIGAQAAQSGVLDSTFVYAIARQESAFISNARSSAGALGLMQLMPATAREVANTAGLRLNGNGDILEPATNIALGSRYLGKMLQDFGGNRILAAAAYNAGPNRVRRWVAEQSGAPLPVDIWVETIPFAETRGYVQNVLAYAVIYGYRMGESLPLLTAEEAAGLL